MVWRRAISESIVLALIGILAIISFYSVVNKQKIAYCIDNLNSLKSDILFLYSTIKSEDSNAYVILQVPKEYQYRIFKKNGEIYIEDLNCNIREAIHENITLVNEIVSKNELYLIKNSTGIYLSPNPPKNLGYSHKRVGSTSPPPSPPQNPPQAPPTPPNTNPPQPNPPGGSPPTQPPSQPPPNNPPNVQPNPNAEIVLVYFRQAVVLNSFVGYPSYTQLENYAENSFQNFVDFITTSLKNTNLPIDFGDPNKYDYYVSNKILYNDIKNSNRVASIILSEMSDITQRFPNVKVLILLFVWDAYYTPLGGYTFPDTSGNLYIINSLKSQGYNNIDAVFYVSVNRIADLQMSYGVLPHEFGHDAGILEEQYINGCGYDIRYDRFSGKIINVYRAFNSIIGGGLKCNILNSNNGAGINPFSYTEDLIDSIYAKYGNSLLTILNRADIDEVKRDVCVGDDTNGIVLIKTKVGEGLIDKDLQHEGDAGITFVILKNSNKDYIIDASECYVLVDESSGLSLKDCYTYFSDIGMSPNIYNLNRGWCISNYDISGVTRDVMGNTDTRYYSIESIKAFENNYNKIW